MKVWKIRHESIAFFKDFLKNKCRILGLYRIKCPDFH